MLSGALSSFWGSGSQEGKMKNPYGAAAGQGGAGMDAKVFVEDLMKHALYVRYERQPGAKAKDIHGRNLAGMFIGTPKGEIDVQAELIRSGFSNYVTSFGAGPRSDDYSNAQREAAAAHRGPMWGGAAPAPVKYRAPSVDDALVTTGSYSPGAVSAIDADTFEVGLTGATRLINVNAPEITNKADYGDHPFEDPKKLNQIRHETWRLGTSERKARWFSQSIRTIDVGPFANGSIVGHVDKTQTGMGWRETFIKGIRPSRGGHAPWMPKRDVMKPHPDMGFPGGRSQPYTEIHHEYGDIETQGLRTSSRTELPGGGFVGRGPDDPVGISQFASIKHGPDGVTTTSSVFTDLIDEGFLRRHNISQEYLRSGKPLPEKALAELRSKGWDRSLGVSGSVLDRGARRHMEYILSGGAIVTQKDFLKSKALEWKAIADKGGKTEFHAWNVSYDLGEIIANMQKDPETKAIIDDVLKKGGVTGREMMESVHAMQFDHMMKSNWAPVMTDRAAFAAAAGLGLKDISQETSTKLGLIKEHTGLRNLMDDIKVAGQANRQTAMEKRAAAYIAEHPEAETAVKNLTSRMSQVENFESWKGFVTEAHEGRGVPVWNQKTNYDLVGDIWSTPGQSHAHPLGSISNIGSDLQEELSRTAYAGEYSGFNNILGNRLEDTASHLLEHQEKLQVSDTRAELIRASMGLHEASGDTTHAKILTEELARIRSDEALNKVYRETMAATSPVTQLERANALYQDAFANGLPSLGDAATAAGGGPALGKRGANKLMQSHTIATWALGAAALWMISENNRIDKTPVSIEGQRRSESWYNSMRGIRPSELPFSNISNFHSGYDTFDVMAQTAPANEGGWAPPVSQVEAIEGNRPYYDSSYSLPPVQYAKNDPPPLPDTSPLSGMDHWAMSDLRGLGYAQAERSVYATPMVARMRATDMVNADAALYAGGPSPARQYLLETFDAMGSGETVDIGGEVARVPLGYSGARAGRFQTTGHAGYVQRLGADAMGSRIRDHATQLRRMPGMPVTTQGQEAMNSSSHAEAEAYSAMVGES